MVDIARDRDAALRTTGPEVREVLVLLQAGKTFGLGRMWTATPAGPA